MNHNDYQPQAGTWTLTAPNGCYWLGMTPLAAVRAEMNERIPATVQLARIFAAADEDAAQEQTEIARLQAQVAELADALTCAEAALADIGDADREPGDDVQWCEQRAAAAIPAVRVALAKVGR